MGDADGPTALSWLSPIGWGQQVRPFAGDRFAVLLIPVLFSVLALVARLRAAGPPRPRARDCCPTGPVARRRLPGLRSPLALAWRLQYPMLVGWLVAYAVLSGIVGSIINDLGDMMDTPQAQEMITALGGTDVLMDAFIALEFSILAFITAAYGIVASRRLATEEADGRAEPVLATNVSRTRFLLSHLVVALVGTTLLTLTQGAAFALASAAQSGETDRIGATIGAGMAYLPAIWLMTGVVVLLFGVVPRLTFVAWILLVGFLLISELGALLSWPDAVTGLSPFGHVPQLPAAAMDWTPIVVLLADRRGADGRGAWLPSVDETCPRPDPGRHRSGWCWRPVEAGCTARQDRYRCQRLVDVQAALRCR